MSVKNDEMDWEGELMDFSGGVVDRWVVHLFFSFFLCIDTEKKIDVCYQM